MSGLVKYGTYLPEDIDKDLEDFSKSNSQFLDMKTPGRYQLRFLPPRAPGEKMFHKVFEHWYAAPGEQKKTRIPCPLMTAKQPCPLCAMLRQWSRTGRGKDRAMAEKMEAKLKVFANVIDRKHPELGPQIYGFGKGVGRDLAKIAKDKEVGGNYWDPKTGFDIFVDREGTGLETRWTVMQSKKESPLSTKLSEVNDWIENQPDLTQHTRLPSAEDIEDMLDGAGGGGSRSSSRRVEEDEDPAPRGARGASRRAEDDIIDGKVESLGDDDVPF